MAQGRASPPMYSKLGGNLGRTTPLGEVSERIVGGSSRPDSRSGMSAGGGMERAASPDTAFDSSLDYSRINNGRHQAMRSDTFNTPSRLDKRFAAADGRAMHDIFEQGFSRSIRSLGKNILDEVRSELRQTMQNLSKEVSNGIEELAGKRDAAAANTLAQVLQTVQDLREETSKHVVDMTPITAELLKLKEEIAVRDRERSEANRAIQKGTLTQLTQNFDQVLVEVREARHQQEQHQGYEFELLKKEFHSTQKQFASLSEGVMNNGTKLKEVMSEQKSFLENASARTIEAIEKIQAEARTHQESTMTFMRNEFGTWIREQALDFSPFYEDLKLTRDSSKLGVEEVLVEVGKIQRALNVDFSRNLQNFMDKGVRVREFFSQTDNSGSVSSGCQTEHVEIVYEKQKKKPKADNFMIRPLPSERAVSKRPKNVIDGEAMKKEMQEALINRGQYNVFEYYYTTGVAQQIAKSRLFETVTFLVIFFNAIWIAVEVDLNDKPTLVDSHPAFQLVENFFCAFFTFEITVRFLAFQNKKHAVTDSWFVFDFVLVLMMVVETWILTLVVVFIDAGGSAPFSNFGMLRMIRVVKLFRMARMARVLRAVPELVVLVKTIGVASRSVFFFFLFWLIIIYVFAIAFRQLTKDSNIGDQYFASVPDAMNSLLLDGIFPANSNYVNELANANPVLWPLIISFILLASLTVMNMLVGVLVEVVSVVASTEKDKMSILVVKYQLQDVMRSLGIDSNTSFPQEEFARILMYPKMLKVIQNIGVDPMALVHTADIIYQDLERDLHHTRSMSIATEAPEGPPGLSFETFIDIVLKQRGKNPATVKDVVEHTRLMKNSFSRLEESFENMLNNMHIELQRTMRNNQLGSTDVSEYVRPRRRATQIDNDSDDGVFARDDASWG